MAGFLGRLFGGAETAHPFDADREAAGMLAALAPCSQYVVVASSRYSSNYRCEVIASVAALRPLVEQLVARSSGGPRPSQVARRAMPQWLRAADTADGKTSYMPPPFVGVVDVYVLDFVMNGTAIVRCNECERVVDHIDRQERNANTTGPWSEWTASWKCPQGHLLYTEDHELHIVRSRES